MTNISTKLSAGLADLAEGHFKKVHENALAMIRQNVANPIPYCLLGQIAAAHGNHIKSVELLAKAYELEADNVVYTVFYAQQLTVIGRHLEAKSLADTAAQQDVDDAFLMDTLGVVYSRTGYHEKAIPFFEQAVELNSKPANFHYNLGASLQFLGRFDDAESAYKNTLQRDPKAYRAWSSLIALKKQSSNTNYIDQLQALFDQLQDDADASLHLGHALAKSFEDLGDYIESFNWLERAKKLKSKDSQSHRISYQSLFKAAAGVGNSRAASTSVDSDAPIFIVGLPRTGTTLVDRIISSHSQVSSAGELNVFPGLIKAVTGTKSNMVLDVETMVAAAELNLSDVGQAYLDSTLELARGARRFTDKMPLNFFYTGLIHQALPNARIIALRRSSMDSCLSNFRQLLTVQFSYYDYTYDLNSTAAFYRAFHDLMEHWRNTLPPDRFMEIRYEDIVLDQENQTRKLLNFCELEWQEECLRFHENDAPVSTASSVQVRQPLYSGSIGRWKRYGDKLEELKQALGELAD